MSASAISETPGKQRGQRGEDLPKPRFVCDQAGCSRGQPASGFANLNGLFKHKIKDHGNTIAQLNALNEQEASKWVIEDNKQDWKGWKEEPADRQIERDDTDFAEAKVCLLCARETCLNTLTKLLLTCHAVESVTIEDNVHISQTILSDASAKQQ